MSHKDKIFKSKKEAIAPFEFNREVASVFDDMAKRSIPFYNHIHTLILDLIKNTPLKNQTIYDLGCSTGETFILIDRYLKKLHPIKKDGPHYIGIDNSKDMIAVAQKKIQKAKIENTQLLCQDITEYKLKKTPFIIMNYTLQFIPPKKRRALLKNIYENLKPKGFFILSEKIKTPSIPIESLLTNLYYDFKKRNRYSQLEIAQKREALENVLIPLGVNQQINLLKKSGFKHVELIFRWYNFGCYLAIK